MPYAFEGYALYRKGGVGAMPKHKFSTTSPGLDWTPCELPAGKEAWVKHMGKAPVLRNKAKKDQPTTQEPEADGASYASDVAAIEEARPLCADECGDLATHKLGDTWLCRADYEVHLAQRDQDAEPMASSPSLEDHQPKPVTVTDEREAARRADEARLARARKAASTLRMADAQLREAKRLVKMARAEYSDAMYALNLTGGA